ncbi:alkaline phosphatase isozyme conversion protein [Erwinia toletana]|uniref:Alkaline phosphatase isozyme conversion protein n=1 Tax=Winslowiella toletana TaxID=92490 RepID=A0ABS4P640_9GAMM|nr:aminopeptidase [Winslowiella toletana]MBP2168060.1 alkaline phosphatase isozyme conversion protein [Winslowiella toletana]
MFSTLRLTALAALLSCGIALPVTAAEPAVGKQAEQQLRNIATWFPGRMIGSPAELLTADYLQQQFSAMGYHSDKRDFHTRYQYLHKDGSAVWRNVTGTSVIAAREGQAPQQILLVAHLDTWSPQSDADVEHNLGGLRLQGADDNAAGLGVMLELAQRLSQLPLHYGVRFVALSGEEIGHRGSEDYLTRMKPEEKKNTLLVINLDSLIVGDKLYFNSGSNTPAAVARQTRDRALAIARRYGIAADSHTPAKGDYPADNAFDSAGFPLLNVRAANWTLGNKDGRQQRRISPHFPQGISRHQTERDNLSYLDRWLPGRIARRSHDTVKILLPLITELANPAAKKAL